MRKKKELNISDINITLELKKNRLFSKTKKQKKMDDLYEQLTECINKYLKKNKHIKYIILCNSFLSDNKNLFLTSDTLFIYNDNIHLIFNDIKKYINDNFDIEIINCKEI